MFVYSVRYVRIRTYPLAGFFSLRLPVEIRTRKNFKNLFILFSDLQALIFMKYIPNETEI